MLLFLSERIAWIATIRTVGIDGLGQPPCRPPLPVSGVLPVCWCRMISHRKIELSIVSILYPDY